MPCVAAGSFCRLEGGRMAMQGPAEADVGIPEPEAAEDDLAGLGLGVSEDEGEQAPADRGADGDVLLEGDDGGADGQEEEEEYEEDDNASMQHGDEADVEQRPGRSKKKSDAQEAIAIREEARALCGRMEQAVSKDGDDLLVGKPALRKLQLLQQVRSRSRPLHGAAAVHRCEKWHSQWRGLRNTTVCTSGPVACKPWSLPCI
jgi:hypothetical protein